MGSVRRVGRHLHCDTRHDAQAIWQVRYWDVRPLLEMTVGILDPDTNAGAAFKSTARLNICEANVRPVDFDFFVGLIGTIDWHDCVSFLFSPNVILTLFRREHEIGFRMVLCLS